VVRWTIAGFAPPLAVLAPLHLLHGLTFAGVFLAGLALVERTSPPDSASAAQTLAAALSGGLFIGLATLVRRAVRTGRRARLLVDECDERGGTGGAVVLWRRFAVAGAAKKTTPRQ
jgi:hypothetical protein